jgi:hypothetical protein
MSFTTLFKYQGLVLDDTLLAFRLVARNHVTVVCYPNEVESPAVGSSYLAVCFIKKTKSTIHLQQILLRKASSTGEYVVQLSILYLITSNLADLLADNYVTGCRNTNQSSPRPRPPTKSIPASRVS